MRVSVVKFEPNVKDPVVEAPVGSEVLAMRLSNHGYIHVVVRHEEGVTEKAPIRFLVLNEEANDVGGGEMERWRYVDSWEFRNGTIAYGFVEQAPPSTPKRKGS